MNCKFKKNEYIAEQLEGSKDGEENLYFVVSVKKPDVILRRESDDELISYEIHHINRCFGKVDKDIIRELYKEESANEEVTNS